MLSVSLKPCSRKLSWLQIITIPGSLRIATITQTHPCKHTWPLSYIWEIKSIHAKLELYIKSNTWIIYAHNRLHYMHIYVFIHAVHMCINNVLFTYTHLILMHCWISYEKEPLIESNIKINLTISWVWWACLISCCQSRFLQHPHHCVFYLMAVPTLSASFTHSLSSCLFVDSLMETQLKTLSGWKSWKSMCGTDTWAHNVIQTYTIHIHQER